MGRCKIHTHSHKNAGESCYICKNGLNRTAKSVACGNETVKVCRTCKDKHNL
jgi:hypothetical protein